MIRNQIQGYLALLSRYYQLQEKEEDKYVQSINLINLQAPLLIQSCCHSRCFFSACSSSFVLLKHNGLQAQTSKRYNFLSRVEKPAEVSEAAYKFQFTRKTREICVLDFRKPVSQQITLVGQILGSRDLLRPCARLELTSKQLKLQYKIDGIQKRDEVVWDCLAGFGVGQIGPRLNLQTHRNVGNDLFK